MECQPDLADQQRLFSGIEMAGISTKEDQGVTSQAIKFSLSHPLQALLLYCYPLLDIRVNYAVIETKHHQGEPTYQGTHDGEKTSSFGHCISPYQYLLVFTRTGAAR